MKISEVIELCGAVRCAINAAPRRLRSHTRIASAIFLSGTGNARHSLGSAISRAGTSDFLSGEQIAALELAPRDGV